MWCLKYYYQKNKAENKAENKADVGNCINLEEIKILNA